MQGEISRDLSPNDLIAVSTKNIPSTSFHAHSSQEARPPARPCGGALIASSQTWAWTCRFAARLRHRWASFAARIAWICRCSIGVAYNWSSAQRAGHRPGWTLCVCFVGRCKSCRGRPPPSLPRHISLPIHFPSPTTRTSAGYFAPPVAWLALQARDASWAVGVQLSLAADALFEQVVGMVARTAIQARPSRSAVLSVRVWALPWLPLRIGWDTWLNLVGGRLPSTPTSITFYLPRTHTSKLRRFRCEKRCKKESPLGSAEEMGWVPFLAPRAPGRPGPLRCNLYT